MLPVSGSKVKHFPGKILQVLRALAVFRVYVLRILRVLAVFRGSVLRMLHSSGFVTVDTLCNMLQVFRGSVLQVLQVLAVFRLSVLLVLRVLSICPKYSAYEVQLDHLYTVSIISCPLFCRKNHRCSHE